MRARAPRLALLAALALAGCEAPPSSGPPPRHEKVAVTRDLLHAFRDAIRAHYELRFLADPANPQVKGQKELDAAREDEKRARARLVRALADAGSEEAKKSEKLSDLIPILRDALVKGGRYAFITDTEDANFALVRLERPPEEHALTILGEKWTYMVYLHDETLIEDYATFRASKLTPAGRPIFRPAVTLGKNVYLDLDACARIGRDLFFPRVASYRALGEQAAAGDEPFTKEAGDLPKLLGVAKDVLRWRSLESFWATVQAQPPAEQVRRFAEDFAAREEVRAACEAFELEKARGAASERPTGERLLALEKRTYLDAIALGEPLGQVATVVGLAGDIAANEKARLDPPLEARLKAAASVTVSLIRGLAADSKGANDPSQDAKDVARLARATPEQLRKTAATLREGLGR